QDDLVVGTNGRSIWILDDLTALRTPEAEWKDREAYLFDPRPAYRYRYSSGPRPGQPMSEGANPAKGATVDYYLKSKPKGDITLEILQGDKVIRTLTSKKPEEEPPAVGDYTGERYKTPVLETKAGVHRVAWDLLMEGAEKIKGARLDTGDAKPGPMALP